MSAVSRGSWERVDLRWKPRVWHWVAAAERKVQERESLHSSCAFIACENIGKGVRVISLGREAYTYEKSLDVWQHRNGKRFELFKSGTKSRLTKVNYCLCVVFTECRVLLSPVVADDEVKKAVEEGH